MKKRFFTLFPLSYNVHLFKDVGMIPFILYRDYGYDSTLITFQNESSYPSSNDEVKGLKIEFIKKDKKYIFGKPSINVILYILKNAKKIDVLNLYHNTKETLLYGTIYKICNPSGILYIKLDINIERFKESITPIKKMGYSFFFKRILSVASFELDFAGHFLISEYPILQNKLIKIPNGIDDIYLKKQAIERYDFYKKENLIITVGRIGAPEKNHKLLLDALANLNLNDWSVVFIGPIEEDFKSYINDFYSNFSSLKKNIHFIGPIISRKELYQWYNRAKIFCMTSQWESFGIVLVEALYFGNYIITTDISSAKEITDNERVGKIIHNEFELSNILKRIINNEFLIDNFYSEIISHSKKFIWRDILKSLNNKLEEMM